MYRTDPPAAYWRDQVIQWGPRVLFAILILVATHFIAKAVQWGVAKGIDRILGFDKAGREVVDVRVEEAFYERPEKHFNSI